MRNGFQTVKQNRLKASDLEQAKEWIRDYS